MLLLFLLWTHSLMRTIISFHFGQLTLLSTYPQLTLEKKLNTISKMPKNTYVCMRFLFQMNNFSCFWSLFRLLEFEYMYVLRMKRVLSAPVLPSECSLKTFPFIRQNPPFYMRRLWKSMIKFFSFEARILPKILWIKIVKFDWLCIILDLKKNIEK